MNFHTYNERYDLTPNFIGVRFSGNDYFIFKLYSYPSYKKQYNVGVWRIKYK